MDAGLFNGAPVTTEGNSAAFSCLQNGCCVELGAIHGKTHESDDKVVQIRDRVLEIIRNNIPIETLFKPELKIDLGVFIKDQMLIQKIALFLAPLLEAGPVNAELLAKYFEKSSLLKEIKSLFNQDPTPYLTLLYEACADVLNKKSFPKDLKSAIEGRIFTVKNALIAQESPSAIVRSQTQCKIAPQSVSRIKAEGEIFIRECLRLHIVKEIKTTTFKEGLVSTSEQLIPFVQNITKIFLREQGADCPDDPLSFRNPSGYNHQGLVAATVMEACLDVLGGYTTRVMMRSDLEPKVTLATVHSVVEVTAPDTSKYLVDPCYRQFHKDFCIDDSLLPTAPVLVLGEAEVDTYIENTIMARWKANAELIRRGEKSVYDKLSQQDQIISFIIKRLALPAEFIPSDPESWVRNTFKRVWDIRTYTPVLANLGFQAIFFGSETADETHSYVKVMGISALSQHLSFAEIEMRLGKLLLQPELRGSNTLEALSLIAQLPLLKRTPYTSLLDVDQRIQDLGVILNAYFRSLKKLVNPEGKDLSVIYGCSGADCITVMLATDANDFTFVDLTPISYHEFEIALAELRCKDVFAEYEIRQRLEKSHNFLSRQLRNGGAMSMYQGGKHEMEELALKFFFDLKAVGVDLDKVSLLSDQNGTGVRVDFPWKYYGEAVSRNRSVTFVTADITQPSAYPSFLRAKLEKKIDIFYMKAAFLAPLRYPQFLPHIAKSINEGGWLMTADKTFSMDGVNPEVCLQQNGLTFVNQKSTEVKVLEELMIPPFDPLCSIPSLEYFPPERRWCRPAGSDMTYWTILTPRKKMSLIG